MSKTTEQIYEVVCGTVRRLQMLACAPSCSPLVLMVSGGSDSLALLYLMHELRERLGIGALRVVHVNHMLRGEAADGDEEFVRRACEDIGIECIVHRIDVAQAAHDEAKNVEAVARQKRYAAAFSEIDDLCARENIPFEYGRIAVAHTQEDRIEGFYMRSIVGTGPGGLGGMNAVQGRVIRPLFDLTRDDLRAYLHRRAEASQSQAWREDATNADIDHFRSFVRHEIVPRARMWNPRLEETLCRTMDLVLDEDAMLQDFADGLLRQATSCSTESCNDGRTAVLTVDCTQLVSYPTPILRRVAYRAARSMLPFETRLDNWHVEQVASGIVQIGSMQEPEARGFSLTLPMGVQVYDEYGTMVFARPQDAKLVFEGAYLDVPGELAVARSGLLHASIHDASAELRDNLSSTGRHQAYVDFDGIPDDARLWVRCLQPGDVICPLGMGGAHKKIADILIDRKIPRRLRSRILVVCTGPDTTDTVVWLVGICVSELFRITPQTVKTVLLTLEEPAGDDEVG